MNNNTCDQCGVCCRLFYINLSEVEYKSGRYKTIFDGLTPIDNYHEAADCGANFLAQSKNGGCIYLKSNSCSIHQKRPQVCREYFCQSKKQEYQNMHNIICDYKKTSGS